MKILLTCQNLNQLAGSKQYVHALTSAFLDGGHDVWIASHDKINGGPMYDEFLKLGVEEAGFHIVEIDELDVLYRCQGRFDVGIISPASCVASTRVFCTTQIQVIHGIVEPEAPVKGVDHYVYISEEAQRRWLPRRQEQDRPEFRDSVIRNAVDLNRYYPTSAPRKKVECVAHFSNYSEMPELKRVCEELGIRFHRIKDKPYEEVLRLLNDADMVFAVGRSAYEAMACGREVVFCDNRSYYDNDDVPLGDGLASWTYYQSQFSNCSGRYHREAYTANQFHREINRYDARMAWTNRTIIANEHDHRMIAKQLLDLI